MPPKKKPVVSDDSFGSSDEEVVLRKSPKKKPAPPKRSTPKKAPKASSAMTGAGGNEGAAENADDKLCKQGYSGQYDCEGNSLMDVEIPSMAAPVMCADGTGSRLMIREINVTNFKSYYGRQRIGPFHKNFSAIIGPNGSGKSNVIDSLLFVFGFRASRIRLKKLKELIHNSSGKKTPEFCSVEVVFQKIIDKEGGDYVVIEGSEFAVGRIAFQDSTSKYTINGKNKTKDEIEKKLKEVGIDLVHNRFLILQGEVEQIALMKPKAEAPGKEGMLEYLEDIIGSSRLKNYLNDIGLKLEEISTEKSQQNQRVKAAEKERDALEGPVREMISHLRCENQATLINNKLLTMKKLRYQTQSKEIKPQIEATNEKMENATARLDEIVTQKKKAEKEFAHLESEKDDYQKKLGVVECRITTLDAKESRRKIDFKRCVKDLSTAEEKVKQYQRELEELMKVPESAEARINMLKGEIEELKERVTSNEAKITKNSPLFEEKSAQLREDKQTAEEEKGQKQQVKDDIEGKRHLAKQELDLLVDDANKVQGRLSDLQLQFDDNKKELANKQKDFERVRKRLPECEKELDEARAAAPEFKKECDKAKSELISLREKLSDEQSAMQAQSHGSKAGQILAEAQKNGILKTYFGRLGDLGAIDAKYDAAVTTNCGGLNAYVVKTKEDGDAALALIKDAKIGRHHFIVLDGVTDYNTMDLDPKHFPAPRVIDLLTIPDPRVKKAFYQSFRDTMIVDTMETARTLLNKKRARYITLGGGSIESNGVISGGGKNRTGGIGSTVRIDTAKNSRNSEELIERLRADEAKKATRLAQFEDNMRKNDQTVFNLSHELQTLRNENRVLNNETTKLSEKVNNLEKQIAFQKKEIGKHQVDEALLEEKREQLEKLDADYEAADKELKSAEEGFTKAKDRLDRIWRELCGRFREEVDNARKDIEKAEKDIADQEGKKKSFERDRAKAESRLNTAETTADEKTKQQEQLKKQEGETEVEREESVKEQKELQASITDVDNRIKTARKSTSQHDEEENTLTREIGLMKDKQKEMKEHLAALEHQIIQVQKEIGGLKMHRIKDYGVLPQKVRQVANHDHIIDEETLEEEKAHQKRKKQQQKGGDDSGDEGSDGDDGAVPALTEEDLKDLDKEDLKFKLQLLQEKVRKNKEHLNMRIIGEYTEKVKKYNAEYGVLQKLADTHAKHMQRQEEWKRVRLQEFMEGFTKIGTSLKEMYQMITLGGDAALDLKDSLDPFTEGISFMVRPPKKSWKNMENLSGGEKTLSSLSLVFALHHYRPTPLYVMDEIDAALDFRNVSIIGHYVKDRTKNAQFIIISLRNNMFELGDRLVGIYKTEDCTKNVVVDPAQVLDKAERLKRALKNVNVRINEQSMLQNDNSDQEETDENAMVQPVRGRKRVSEDSNTSASSHVAEPLKRMDSRLSPASDPGRVSRLPPRSSSNQDSDF